MTSDHDHDAKTCQYVYESGKHYLVISYEDTWKRFRITARQTAGVVENALPRVIVK